MAVTGHTVMSDSACRASALGASVVASATASATRALLNPPTYVLVYSAADLPAAVAGVITLAANTTYVVTTTVDLAPGSYIELWAANNTSAGATLTAIDLNFTINRLD